jgi:hypothetical protein
VTIALGVGRTRARRGIANVARDARHGSWGGIDHGLDASADPDPNHLAVTRGNRLLRGDLLGVVCASLPRLVTHRPQ